MSNTSLSSSEDISSTNQEINNDLSLNLDELNEDFPTTRSDSIDLEAKSKKKHPKPYHRRLLTKKTSIYLVILIVVCLGAILLFSPSFLPSFFKNKKTNGSNTFKRKTLNITGETLISNTNKQLQFSIPKRKENPQNGENVSSSSSVSLVEHIEGQNQSILKEYQKYTMVIYNNTGFLLEDIEYSSDSGNFILKFTLI
ncbi:uncharacterized protein NDAI_0E01430 [Naumovozyma dairenensis CBS 421]|uniref:Uncharacterized protein n=1 Tax=Naumovozyma dairenensis (strain ATCC 10597 / BCRC 20456 / CBS 421 / NBRC 0211 / NRRL Y-12639) TaxID=1071378 RepID=G0WB39_NAUDC|nr:hypothetical protein NDAI_0E01430 [Naumovozyma dairenensis CBS 421]CCD24959.1 hypothetical protein NDAI_0E01430 [Naumovozyma dairenensis CBS 421]